MEQGFGKDLTLTVSCIKGEIYLTPHLPHSWGWRKWWDGFLHYCKELAKFSGVDIYISQVSHYIMFRSKFPQHYKVTDWETIVEKALPTIFSIPSAQNELEFLYLIAPHIYPEVEPHKDIAVITLYPIQNFSFLLPYPIPSLLFTDDLEQLLATPHEGGGIGADAITVRYRGYLRELARHISGGFLIFMAYLVIYYATLENTMKLFATPEEILSRAQGLDIFFVEKDILTRRLEIVAEHDDLPLDVRAIALRLFLDRTRRNTSPIKEIRSRLLQLQETELRELMKRL